MTLLADRTGGPIEVTQGREVELVGDRKTFDDLTELGTPHVAGDLSVGVDLPAVKRITEKIFFWK